MTEQHYKSGFPRQESAAAPSISLTAPRHWLEQPLVASAGQGAICQPYTPGPWGWVLQHSPHLHSKGHLLPHLGKAP